MGKAVNLVLGLLPALLVFGPMAFFLWRGLKRRRDLIRSSRAQGIIGPAALVQGANLPRHYDALAQLGTAGPAPQSLNERILRPSVGVRLLVLGLGAALVTFVLRADLASPEFHEAMQGLPVPPVVVQLVALVVAASAQLYIFGFSARYDREVLIVTRMVFARREYRWTKLEWIGDDGAYDLVLSFGSAGKAKVLKHCPGIDEFKAFAVQKLQENKGTHARTARG